MARILRSKPAREDLRDAWLYIAQEDVAAADRFLERIDQAVRMIADCPEIGELQENLKEGLRRFVLGNS